MHCARNFIVVLILACACIAAQAQPPTAPQAPSSASIVFDIVSVKQNKTNDAHPGSMIRPDGFDAENINPSFVLNWAFGRGHGKVLFSGLPDWARTDRFDIIAKVGGSDVATWGTMSDAEKKQMIRDLFADRFKLRTHVEAHDQPIFALVIAKGGAKLQAAKPVASSLTTLSANGFSIRPTDGWFGFSRTGIVARNITMEEFAADLTTLNVGRQVQDHTDLAGRFDLKLNFTPSNPAPAPSADATAPAPPDYPDLFTAIQEQLGLKLEPGKGPVQMIVIDDMERPTEN